MQIDTDVPEGKVALYSFVPEPITNIGFGFYDPIPQKLTDEVEIKIVDGEERVVCQYCRHNLVGQTPPRKDGTRGHRKYKGDYICGGCKKILRMREPGFPKKMLCGRGENREDYLIHRKECCENADGRLGFKCRFNKIDAIASYKMITVDHILENNNLQRGVNQSDADPLINHPHNLQSLCSSCHTIKNVLVDSKNKKVLKRMLSMHWDKYNIHFTEQMLDQAVEIMVTNKSKSCGEKVAAALKKAKVVVFAAAFMLTMGAGCSKIDPVDVQERTSVEMKTTQMTSSSEYDQTLTINYDVWRF